jgi:hypothetical protein
VLVNIVHLKSVITAQGLLMRCCKKLEYVIEKLDTMQHNLEQSTDDV